MIVISTYSVIMIFLLLFSTLFLGYCKADLPEGAVGPSEGTMSIQLWSFTLDFEYVCRIKITVQTTSVLTKASV